MMLLLSLLGCGGGALDEQYFLRVGDADLRVDVEGEASASRLVLLLHGGPGGSGADYNLGAWSERMEAEVTMVYLDQRGQGASQGVYGPEDVTVAVLAEDVAAVLRSLKVRYGESAEITLMGHSWGGMLGLAALLWTDAGEDVDAWIEVGGAHDVLKLNQYAVPMFIDVGEDQIEEGNHVSRWQEIVQFAEHVDPDRITARDSTSINRYAFEAEALVPEVRHEDGVSGLELAGYYAASPVGWPTAQWTGGQTNDLLAYETEVLSFSARLGDVSQPALLVTGAYDFVVPPELSADALDAMPGAARVVLEESGHSPMFNQPHAFADALLDFIDGL